jgi:hypothetical protein
MRKRGQFRISFGMMFSMILIAVFVFLAFYVISMFLDIKDEVETGGFIDDLGDEIERLHKSTGGAEKTKTLRLGKDEITHVCFFDFERGQSGPYDEQFNDIKRKTSASDNFYFYPRRFAEFDSAEIKHVDMENFEQNPYCIRAQDREFEFRLSKDIGDSLIKISRS